MTMPPADIVRRIAKIAAACKYDPLKWAEAAWHWGHGDLANEAIRQWQRDVLADLRDHLANPTTRHTVFRLSIAAGHGIGKSALFAMLADWAMSCHAGARVRVTANTEAQLRTTTSPEFSKWFRSGLTRDLFDVDTMSITQKQQPKNWRLDFVPWSEHNTEGFQGLHNKGKLVMVLMDEGSNIADPVFDVVEGAMTDADTILIFIVFANPTRATGRFRETFRRYRKMWRNRQIDSRTVEGINVKELNERVALYGEDSDYVKVRIKGQFPSSSDRQFIGTDLVDAAFGKPLRDDQFNFAPVIITCDPAWSGGDETVIGMRQGLMFDILEVIRKNDNDVLVAQKIASYEVRYGASAVFIDAGYGTGIKSVGDVMGRAWQLVWFAGAPVDPGCINKRVEMWRDTREWLRAGGSIPDDQVLYEDLIGPETLPRLDGKVALESKEDMKKRHLPSPNRGDALALSFAAPVALTSKPAYGAPNSSAVIDSSQFNPHG
jgi:hypothetical protein